MGTTTSIESQRALAWIVRQLSWERALDALRAEATQSAEAAETAKSGDRAAA